MKIGLNTLIYECGNVKIKDALISAKEFGFEYIDYPAGGSWDPTSISKIQKNEIKIILKDLGLKISQMHLLKISNFANPDLNLRKNNLDYLKECSSFNHDLGGKQVIVGFGCGVYESYLLKEECWLNSVKTIKEFAEWGIKNEIIIDLEMDPHVYYLVNSTVQLAKILEDINMPNVFPNIDIGHLCITRELPKTLEKFRGRILHVHLSETDSFEHTNSILGQGIVNFKIYIDKVLELGIEETCKKYGEEAIAAIEMGGRKKIIDDPNSWIKQSIDYLNNVFPNISF